jgi:ATP/maltotriose-dependent transcriptional regulator MalT
MMAYVAIILGDVARAEGQLAAAQKDYQRCYDLHKQLDNPEGMAVALVRLANLAAERSDYSRAAALFEQSIFLYRKLNDPGGLARSLHSLGEMALGLGDDAQAGTYFQESLQLAVEIRWLPLVLLQFTAIGELLHRRGDVELATVAWRTVAAHPAADSMMQQRAQANLAGAAEQLAGRAAKSGDRHDPLVLATVLQERLATIDVATAPQRLAQDQPRRQPAPAKQSLVEPLSERELEILRLLALGLSNQQIAEALTLVVGTVKAHNHHIFAKLGVSNRVQALARARELNLLA